jgi:peptidoglycan/xylan/chitin deacetylase (PgdA/CDA1 family)
LFRIFGWGKLGITLMQLAKLMFLYICKFSGLFFLSSRICRKKLQILCYHGLSFDDEHNFQPKLSMQPHKFRKRMTFLKEKGFEVLALQEGLDRLTDGKIKKRSVVITFDDGFHNFFTLAKPILMEFRFPSTVYVTSYYVKHGNPVFRLAVRYMFWKSRKKKNEIFADIPCMTLFGFEKEDTEKEIMWKLIEYAENYMDEDSRLRLSEFLGKKMGVSFQHINRRRLWHLMTPNEIEAIARSGVDVQLHTHRHRFPLDTNIAKQEIEENRAVLEPIVGKKMRHFCYPSGVWNKTHWKALKEAGCYSATTCESRMNSAKTPLLAFGRFLDAEDIPQIEFEAEVYGFKDLLRYIFRFSKKGTGSVE